VPYRAQVEFAALKKAAEAHAWSLEGDVVDVTNEGAVRKFTENILAKHKRIDVLVNTVGAYAGEPSGIQMHSGYVLSRVVVPVILIQGKGAIVNVASPAAVDYAEGTSACAASKAAAVAMMNSLAADLKSTGVGVNSVISEPPRYGSES
jgi:NAD(P)-dependent dehydrogenase (short-subunit alcohol dehydrogenase family)